MLSTLKHDDLDHLAPLQPPDWDDIMPHMEFYMQSPFCRIMKWTDKKSIKAIGAIIFHQDSAWLAHIIVHPEFRNKGYGTKITRALIHSIDAHKYSTIYLIATELGFPVYAKLGFETEEIYHHFRGTKNALLPEFGNLIRRYRPTDQKELLFLDHLISGEFRAKLFTPHFKETLISHEAYQINGAYFPTLGEGLIVAKNKEVGIRLMKERIRHRQIAVLPSSNIAGLESIEKEDFSFFKSSRRMRLGTERAWRPQQLFNRVSGQVG